MHSWLSRKVERSRRAEAGFTLIELLVVIIILGILAAVVVFAIGGVGDKGKAAAIAIDARTINTAQEAFCAKNGFYGTEQQLVEGGLLSEQSKSHDVILSSGGSCTGAGVAGASAYSVSCAVDTGCGPSSTPVLGGTLVIANGTAAPSSALNPAINSEGGLHSNSEDMFNGLLRYELDGSIGGDLAQTFNINNAVPSGSNPNCATATCDPMTTVATFVLRPNVVFHGVDSSRPGDGDILDPDDVEFSFSEAILAAHGRTTAMNTPLGVTGSKLTTVVPDDAITTLPPSAGNGGTVTFNFRQVFAPLPFSLNVTEAPILSETAYGPCFTDGSLFNLAPAAPLCAANTSPVGTGPFRFLSLGAEGIRTVKNPDYFRFDGLGNRLPYFDQVFKKVVTGNFATALESGSVDVAAVPNADAARLRHNTTINQASTPRGSGGGNCITTIAFNTTKRQAGSATVAPAPPGGGYPATSPYFGQDKPNSNVNAPPHRILGDSSVREAIFKSLDRNKIWTDVQFSAGRVADAPIHSIFALPNGGAYQGAQPLPTFDRAAAATLLDAAGWSDTSNPDGFRRASNHPNEFNADSELVVADGIRLDLEYINATGNEAFAAEIKSQLKLVGINVTTITVNNADFVAPRIFHARTFDMGQISYCNNDEPQFGVRRQYHSDQVKQTNAFTNASGYKSTIMDQLWLDASKAADTATYQAKFLQIQRMALGLSTPGGPALTAVEIAQKIPMVQVVESAGTRGSLAICTGFNNNNTGLYIEAAHCKRT